MALGKSAEAEYKDGTHKISEQLIGEVHLSFFSRKSRVLDILVENVKVNSSFTVSS